MTDHPPKPLKAYRNEDFLTGRHARPVRMLAEYMEPESRFQELGISDTIVIMGSARIPSREDALAEVARAKAGEGDLERAESRLAMSRHYEAARELAARLTAWSKGLEDHRRRFVICTGGGPGIMEAANRGASEARGLNIGLNISIPREQFANPHITRQLAFEFHYFFMRKFWFVYLAKAVVIFPGGFGTLDEFMEILTLIQTGKLEKRMPLLLFGASFWNEVVDFQALVRHGMISAEDLNLFTQVDTVDEAFAIITRDLETHALHRPGAGLRDA